MHNPYMKAAKELIATYDKDKDDMLSRDELKPFFINYMLKREGNTLDFNCYDAWYNKIDADKDEKVGFQELWKYLASIGYKHQPN